jgi:hypothetical protein
MRRASRAPAIARTRTSSRWLASTSPGRARIWPRARSATATPSRFTATRAGASTRAHACPNWCKVRTRPRAPLGKATSSSPTASGAPRSVPVTTVPAPLTVNTRSIGSRVGAALAARCTPASAPRTTARSSSSPTPARALTRTSGAPAYGVSASSAATSSAHASAIAGGAASILLTTATSAPTPSSAQIAEVLAGLRHHAVVGGHHQERQVDAGGAGHHRLDEALVPGHVDDVGPHAVPAGRAARTRARS